MRSIYEMDEFMSFIKLYETNLTTNDEHVLREEVLKLEQKCREQFKDLNIGDLNRRLWTCLIELSIEIQNVQLAILTVAKLRLVQLALLLHSTLARKTSHNKETKLLALYYVANYFNVNTSLNIEEQYRLNNLASSSFEPDQLADLFVNEGKWTHAIQFIDDLSVSQRQKEFNKALIYHKYALHLELEGCYAEALKNYELFDNQGYDGIRILLKQHMNLAFGQVKRYCLSSERGLRHFWYDFLLSSGGRLKASEKLELVGDYRMLLINKFKNTERNLLGELPEKVVSFIKDISPSRWTNKRQVDYIILFGSSLDSNTRRQLADLATFYQETNLNSKACNLYLCLDQLEALLSFLPKLMDQVSTLKLVYYHGNQSQLASFLIGFTRNTNKREQRDEAHKSKEGAMLFISYLKLGLINEALYLIATGINEDESSIVEGIELIEGIVERRFTASLSDIDPVIERAVMIRVLKTKKCQVLLKHVITIIILSITIFLTKLDNIIYLNECIAKLEIMFKLTSECFVNSKFVTPDALIRAMSSLVDAVKDKLDLLTDCDIIRDSFRQMIEATADRCMIESRYKSAAMLYNHIEDYKSAVKSLMRMGDLDVVINYSLLVRDIAVNRITINYLKHLNVDQAIVRDFITRSQL